jgi:NAD(P)-dependent dehydrogenase (short-subunit alcohol dehydrogenase family)
MARALVKRGASVAGLDVNAAGLDAMRSGLEKAAGRFLPIVVDIDTPQACAEAVDSSLTAFGRLDILVNNAGIGMGAARPAGHQGPLRFWETDADGWARIMTANCFGSFFIARAVTPHLIAAGWGRIVNVTTNLQTMLKEGRCAYGPSKAAFEAGGAIWARELEGTGVTVNALFPGGQTNTGIFPKELPRDGMLAPEIMVPPLLWLVSSDSDGVTGRRFAAEGWDASLPPRDAGAAIGAPAAWGDFNGRPSGARAGS